ncbi:MAG: ubiquinone anaerobic biosynthesis protein UbiU [Alphaproteobacteria bacterium]
MTGSVAATKALELVCPAGTPAALRAAVDAGADVVYCGFRDDTNARNFPGLNFGRDEMGAGIVYAHDKGCAVYVTVNTYPAAGRPAPWRQAVDDAVTLGADALIMADIGLLDYAARTHPDARLHLSVQASAANAEAIRFHHDRFGIRRVVLPRVLTLAEIAALNAAIPVATEVFAFGGMCVMAEGRCALSGYASGLGPNRHGVCSPASHVRFEERGEKLVSRLGDFTIDIRDADAPAGYPTLCKGCFSADGRTGHLFEDPVSLDAMALLPDLMAAGVAALKIEGRQRGRAYVTQVVGAFRAAVDAAARGETPPPSALASLTEGARDTTGAFTKSWR